MLQVQCSYPQWTLVSTALIVYVCFGISYLKYVPLTPYTHKTMPSPTLTNLLDFVGPKPVPNEVRRSRLAIVGEAPGRDEEAEGRPFVGTSGRLLWGVASNYGLYRSEAAVLNVCQLRPPNNDISEFDWDDAIMQDGRAKLAADLDAVQPNLVLCLGGTALRAAAGEHRSVDNWRGSVFMSPVWHVKCLATYHPAAVLRQYEWIQLFRFDIAKAIRESSSAALNVLERVLRTDATVDEVLFYLNQIREQRATCSVDIEGGIGNVRCISFAPAANRSLTVPFVKPDGTSYWSVDEEARILQAIALLLEDAATPKVLQNYLYDAFVLPHTLHLRIAGLRDDTMLKHWELLPELEKSLAVQTSIYTTEPYYKGEREAPDGPELWRYCAKDSAITYEINDVLEEQLRAKPCEAHYRFNVSLLAPLNYMQLRGVKIDTAKRAQLAAATQLQIYELQHAVHVAAKAYGCYYDLPTDVSKLVAFVGDVCCYKRHVYVKPSDLLTAPKAPWRETISRIVELIQLPARTDVQNAELDTLLERHINVDSSKQMVELLYQKMALPTQYKKLHGRRTDKPTADALAMLSIYIKTRNEDVKRLLQLRGLLTRLEGLTQINGPHDRMHSSINLVGTETGRVQTYKSNFGTGKSIQTETSKHKCCYAADDGMYIAELDLSAADMWTVAAECAYLGDTTLLDDLKARISPHKLLCLAYHDSNILHATRDEIKTACKAVSKEGWLYYTCKRAGHMTNYGGGPDTMSDQITKDAWSREAEVIYVEPAICAKLQQLYLSRYQGVRRRITWLEAQLRNTGRYTSAGGHTRVFFGRRDDRKTLGEYLADGPQENTTYVTNLSLHRLWHDPKNRDNGRVIIEPLFHRHDALGVQFPQERVESCCALLREWFTNTITVAGVAVTIPAEGGYGLTWGELTHEI